MENTIDSRTYSAMQNVKPLAVFRKTILGKVFVQVLNPYTELSPEGVMLYGKDNFSETAMVKIWSEKQLAFFVNRNRRLLNSGVVIQVTEAELERISQPMEKPIEQYSDDELIALINKPYIKFTSILNKITSEPVLNRMINLAIQEEKSEKFVNKIRARLSDLQGTPMTEI